jgi:hypothetical protein
MKNSIAIFSLLIGCQDTEKPNSLQDEPHVQDSVTPQDPTTGDNPEEEPQEEPEEEPQEEPQEEDITDPMHLPDLLACASESTGHLDFFGTPYAITMELQNIYGEANTTFFIDHIHEMAQEGFQGGLVGGSAVFQSLPEMGETSFDIELNEAGAQESNLSWLSLFQGEGSLSLNQVDRGRLEGVLSFPHEQNMRPTLVMHCWEPDLQNEFTYDPDVGLCLNEAGEEGYNPASQAEVRETSDGHCVDMDGWIIDEGNYSYPNFEWDLRGANLNGASISFAHMKGADFRGAKMETFSYGYTQLKGPIDDHTTLPNNCESEDDRIDCIQ